MPTLARPLRRATTLILFAVTLGGVATGCGAQGTSDLVVSSDPELARLASGLLPELARRSGMELKEPVRVEVRSREELVRYLETKLEEDLPPEEARARVDAFALLGLVPPDLDLREVLMALYTEQVAGFYEPDSVAVFVLDDQSEEDLRGLLLHELVHAVQDQTVDLEALTADSLGSDRAAAAQAAIEGHATLVMFEFVASEQLGDVDLSALPEVGLMLRQSLQGAQSEFQALASAPRVLQESLLFPYLEGAIYLQRRWVEGERVVPFGDELPLSTDEIMTEGETAPPVELTLAVSGGTPVLEEVLGRLQVALLLEELGHDAGLAVSAPWIGDRFVLVERSDGERALIAYLLWEDAGARDDFSDALTSVAGAFGAEATIERLEVDGWAATRLTVGESAGVSVRVEEARRR